MDVKRENGLFRRFSFAVFEELGAYKEFLADAKKS